MLVQTVTDYACGVMWVCKVKGSVAALADLVFFVLEGQRRGPPGALHCSLVQFDHLLREMFE